MNQYNYPTIILSGQGALADFALRLKTKTHQRVLIVTDKTLISCGLVDNLTRLLTDQGISYEIFSDVHPNPIEEDVEKGAAVFKEKKCDSIIALGGGSPMDTAKAIKILTSHPLPLEQYDDALNGFEKITNPMPPLYAIPTTAGTGSEVGRSAVIISRKTGKKAIFFHPTLMPDMAVLEPKLTEGLPPHITAATGMDAFVHCMEAYFSPGFHPIADGIALQGMELVLDWLPEAVKDGHNLDARERMLIAASMGAAAFQKGLGMIHSLAHPLSSRHGLHHGLANALLLKAGVAFLEKAALTQEQAARVTRVWSLFENRQPPADSLAMHCQNFIMALGIRPGLANYGIEPSDLAALADEAYSDPCHQSNMVPASREDLLSAYKAAM
jgi:4-hydroxybutyrate dehydrogenase